MKFCTCSALIVCNGFHFYLTPLCALVEGGQQLVDGLSVHLDQGLAAWAGLIDLRKGSDGVGNNLKTKLTNLLHGGDPNTRRFLYSNCQELV